MVLHKQLAEKTPLLPEHFDRWLELFELSVDCRFAGERAALIKQRARQIAERMVANICSQYSIEMPIRQNGEAAIHRQQ